MKLTIREMTRVALFSSLICIASLILKFGGEIVVPFSILPLMTMMAGAILGARLGAFSTAVYVLIGLLGVPVFAKPPFGGFTYVLQPTFGFLLGFILSAYVIGRLLEKNPENSLLRYTLAMVAGIVVMYAVGIPYLYGIIKFYLGKPFTMWRAVQIGMLPFVGLDLVKGLLAAVVAKSVHSRLVRQEEKSLTGV